MIKIEIIAQQPRRSTRVALATLGAVLDDVDLTRWQRRLADELDDDRVTFDGDDAFRRRVIEELDHCRRAPVFEGRRPTYGAMVLPGASRPRNRQDLLDHIAFDVVSLDGDLTAARLYADGRASYVVRDAADNVSLACFERPLMFEADIVHLQELTGAAIIQRTPVLDVVRLVVDRAVISWDGRNWQSRPTAVTLCDEVAAATPELDRDLVGLVLELAIHWLAPARIGATIVLAHGHIDVGALDVSTASRTPALSVGNRRHFSALVAVLRQHDLAVVAGPDGDIHKVAVGLRWSDAAEEAVDNSGGMRHRSAQRYSYDQRDATVIVVSEDGPVTIYRRGAVISTTGARR
jgi:hypothetical protein